MMETWSWQTIKDEFCILELITLCLLHYYI